MAKHVHRNHTTIADILDIGYSLESREEKPQIKKVDNQPTVEQVAMIARNAKTTDEINAAMTIYELSAIGWSSEDNERFWQLMN